MSLCALRARWEKTYEKEANPERNSKRQQINVHVHNRSTGLARRTFSILATANEQWSW
jgi:hypothetical protein